MPKVSKTKQKQSQKQNVKQTVIIKLDKEGKRIKRRRKRTRPTEGVDIMQRQLPPPVIYQSSYAVPVNPQPTPNMPLQIAPTIRNIAPPQTEMQDVGIGTEGFVNILDVPTKREQLENLITPVPKSEPIKSEPIKPEPIPSEFFSKKIAELRSMREAMSEPMPVSLPIRTRRTKKEMQEARQMEREDIASINLGLAQFEPSFEKPQISKGLPEEQASEPIKIEPNIPEAFTPLFAQKPLSKTGRPIESLMSEQSIAEEQNIPESVLKGKRVNVNSWNYWLSKYAELTGEKITEYRAKQQFGTKDKFSEFIKSNLK